MTSVTNMTPGPDKTFFMLNSFEIIQLFHACLVNSQNYATRCRGQLNALLPEAARPRAIVN